MAAELKSFIIDEDLVQVRMPFFRGYVNFYVLSGTDGLYLVDAGSPEPNVQAAVAGLLDRLHPQGVRGVRAIFLTHVHSDHIGLARWIQEESGVPCYASRGEIDYLWRRSNMTLADLAAWFARQGAPPEAAQVLARRYPRLRGRPPELTPLPASLDTGHRQWDIIPTPGHSVGHVCYYNRRTRRLLVGDHMSSAVPPEVGSYPATTTNLLPGFIASLHQVRDLPVESVLPGHGAPFDDLAERVDQVLGLVDAHSRAVLAAASTDGPTTYDVGKAVFDPESDIPNFSALARAKAHLEELERQGLVEQQANRWFPATIAE